MGFLDSLKAMFAGDGGQDRSGLWIYVRCRRCGEVIKTRVDLHNNLSLRDEGGYFTRKTLVGNRTLCFNRVEVTLVFDANRQIIEQEAVGGEFITAEEYEAAEQT